MLATAAFTDLQNYIKRRVSYMQYKVGSTYTKVNLSNVQVLSSGVIRVQASLVPTESATITQVALYNTDGEMWAYQDVSIAVSAGQIGVLFWFDFTVEEGESDA